MEKTSEVIKRIGEIERKSAMAKLYSAEQAMLGNSGGYSWF